MAGRSRAGGGRFRRLAASLLVFAVLGTALPSPAAAQTAISLISNTAQANGDFGSLDSYDQAQAFTTGANANGYTLTGVDIDFNAYSGNHSYTVSIWTEVSGSPGVSVDNLTSPSSLTDTALSSYTTSGIDLAASTTYFVHVDSSSGVVTRLQNTASNSEDSGGQSGWSIADGSVFRLRAVTTGAWTPFHHSKKIAIKGYAKTGTNTAPTVATVIPDQTATAATAFIYAFPATTFSDADGDTLTYTATKADGTALPSWLSFSASSRTFSFPPQAADVGTVSVKVTASDGSASVSDTFDIVVSAAANTAPTVATVIPDQTATAGSAFSYAFPATTFSDADSDTLTYTATKADGTALPTWLSFSASTFSGTPQAADVGTVSVKVTASDGSASVSDTFDIVVSAAPSLGTTCNAPDLAGRTQIWTNTINVGGPGSEGAYGILPILDEPGTFTDPSNVSFSYESNPYPIYSILVRADARLDVFLSTALPSALKAKLAFHVCDEQFAFTDAPYNAGSLHHYRWTSTGLDWSSESTRTLYMSVLGTTNNAPTVAAVIQDQTATAGTAFFYPFPATTFSDADGDTLTYTATQADGTALPSWLSFSASTRTFSGTPQTADVATVSVKVTASDGSASVSDTFDIVVSVAVRGAPFGVVVDAPSGAVGLMRARWQAPPNASGIQGYHVRYRTVGTVLGASFRKVRANARELLLRYLEPGANYEAQICTVGSGERRGPCSLWARLQLAARNTVPANDFTVSLELPDGSAKATVAWDGTLTYRIRVRGVYDSSVLEFATSTVGTVATRLGPPGGRVPEFDSYDNNSGSTFSGYRGFARMFIVWDSPSSGYWERTQTVWTPAGANNAHVLELIDKPERFFTNRLNRIGTPSSLCVEITDSSNNVTAACGSEQIEIEPPTVEGAPAVSEAGADGHWTEGETVEVTLAFSEAVEVDTANGVPSVGLGLGGPAATRSAPYLRGGGTAELVFGYTLVDGDGAHTVMAVTPDSLALNGGAIRSVATSADAALGHNGTLVLARPPRAPEGPSARFEGVPANHDGSDAFTVELHFSAEPEGLSYRTVQNGLLKVDGGTVTRAARTTRGSNLGWRVTVAPSGTGDVQIQLPARPCGKPNAICIGNRPLRQAAQTTIPGIVVTVPLMPLTASFSGTPTEHDGTSPFELQLRLSEEPAGLSYRTVQSGLFDVSGGTIGRAWRLVRGNNAGWGLRVEPSGLGTTTLVLRATTDCAGTPGVCTSDGRMLGGGLQARISGPPTLAVADAEVDEASGVTLDFAVTLSRALTETVTVGYRTVDGSASAGADYTNTTGTLTFAAGETSKTVSVPVLDDEHDEGSETMTLRLRNPSPARVKLSDGEATGTINNTDAMPQAWLARFGRTVGEQAMEAVEARFGAARTPGLSGSIGGQQLSGLSGAGAEDAEAAETDTREGLETLADWLSGKSGEDADTRAFGSRTLSGREVLTGSSFAFSGGTAERGFAAFWGRGAVTRFDGREGELTLDGEVASAMLGADFSREAVIAGLMVSQSRGAGGYRSPNGSGEVSSTLTALFPYGRYALSERVSVWGMAGYGEGTLTLTPEGQAPMRPDMDLLMGALGVRGVLLDGGTGGPTLAAKSDAMAVRTSSDAVTGLAASEADVTRVRLALEGSQPVHLGGDAVLTPSLEFGVRHDGGDAETGFGADFGAGLALTAPSRGLSAEIRARGLLTHEADGMREWGVSGTLAWDPAPDSDRGLSLSLSQTVGAQASGGADALLARPTLAGLGAEEDEGPLGRRFDARLGYGLGVFDDRWTATPELGLGLSDTGTELRLGWRLSERVAAGLAVELGLEGTRRESADGHAGPEHGLGVGLGWRLVGARASHAAFEMRLEAARRDVANDDRAPEDTIWFKVIARW